MQSIARIALKQLWLERCTSVRERNGRLRPVLICPLCGGENRRMDLHEVVISRKVVRGNPDLLRKITEASENCITICDQCNAGGEQNDEAEVLAKVGKPARAESDWARKYLFVNHILRFVTAEQVIAWINGLGLKQPEEYLLFVKGKVYVGNH